MRWHTKIYILNGLENKIDDSTKVSGDKIGDKFLRNTNQNVTSYFTIGFENIANYFLNGLE